MKDFWTRVREKCPKAYSVFNEHLISTHHRNAFALQEHNECRLLYDFFDSKGVYVGISVFTVPENKPHYDFAIRYIGQYPSGDHTQMLTQGRPIINTRPEAELASWERAFEILEKQLTDVGSRS